MISPVWLELPAFLGGGAGLYAVAYLALPLIVISFEKQKTIFMLFTAIAVMAFGPAGLVFSFMMWVLFLGVTLATETFG